VTTSPPTHSAGLHLQEKTMNHPETGRLLRPFIAAIAATVALVACGDRQRADAPPAAQSPPSAPPENTAAPPTGLPPAGAGATTGDAPATDAAAASAARVVAADRDFLSMAASSGTMEVEASRLALERSKNQQVRTFAQRMVDEHSKTNESLHAVAMSVGMTDLPSAMMATHSGHLERLRALQGQAFDREYAAQVGVAGHTEALALFDRASSEGSHQHIKTFAEKTLPALRDHLQEAQSVAKAVGVPADRLKAASQPPDLSAITTTGSTGTTGTAAAGGGATGGTGSADTMGSPGAPGKGTSAPGGSSGSAGTSPTK
jgi:putative membrane protein